MTSLTLIKRLAGPFAVAAVFAVSLFFAFSHAMPANANPSYFVRSQPSGSATTSLNFMTVGNATSTLSWDTGSNTTCFQVGSTTPSCTAQTGTTQAMDSAVLQLFIRASTTPINTNSFGTTTLNVRIEQSDNGTDWSLSTSSILSTSLTEQMGSNFIASTSATVRTITVSSPLLRYQRALVGVNPGSPNNAAVWMQFVGKRENN